MTNDDLLRGLLKGATQPEAAALTEMVARLDQLVELVATYEAKFEKLDALVHRLESQNHRQAASPAAEPTVDEVWKNANPAEPNIHRLDAG